MAVEASIRSGHGPRPVRTNLRGRGRRFVGTEQGRLRRWSEAREPARLTLVAAHNETNGEHSRRAVEVLLLDDVSFPGRHHLEVFGAAPDLLGCGAGGLGEDFIEFLERDGAFDRWRFGHGHERG